MKFIPMSFFGGGEFPQDATAKIARFTGLTTNAFGEFNYPDIDNVDVYPISGTLTNIVFTVKNTGDTIEGDAQPYSQPFFVSALEPDNTCSTYTFNATSSGPSSRFLNYVGCNGDTQSIDMGNNPFSKLISCKNTPTPTISGFTTDTSVTKSYEEGYNPFDFQGLSNRLYRIRFTSNDSVITPSNTAVINYVDRNGILQYQVLSGTVELECQTALHCVGGDPIIGSINLSQEILGPVNRITTPYPFHNKIRKYRISPQFTAQTLNASVAWSSGSQRFVQSFSDPTDEFDLYATDIPISLDCAMATIVDVSDWNIFELASSSVDTNICDISSSLEYYINETGSLNVGNTIYKDYTLTTPVTSSYWREINSNYYVLTNGSGNIISTGSCIPLPTGSALYDIESGSVINVASNSITDLSGEENNGIVFTANHFISGTFDGQQTLEVNCPTTNSGSAMIRYDIVSEHSPTGSMSYLSSFYMNGNPVWSLSTTERLAILGDFDEDPGNDTYGFEWYGDNTTSVKAGSVSVTIPSGSFNNPGWNILQYSIDSSVTPPRVNYNINGSISGSFNAENTIPNLETVRWNQNGSGTAPNSKLANGSHFQVLDVRLTPTTTSSMDTLFNQYNRYGL